MSWQSSRSNGWRLLLALGVILSAASSSDAADPNEPCNPIIDGTYCATNMPKKRAYVAPRQGMTALDDYNSMVPNGSVGGPPGTLVGINIRGNQTCFGLLRRSVCD